MRMRFSFGLVAVAVLAVAIPSAVRAQVPLGAEFRVDGGAGDRVLPFVYELHRRTAAMSSGGEFVVTWTSAVGSDFDVMARRFGGDGAPRGPAFRVNVGTTGIQSTPSVAMDEAGGFVIVWNSGTQPGNFGRRFSASGAPRGGDFQIGVQNARLPSVATLPAGGFVVVWGGDGATLNIFGQRYDATGATVGAEFIVNASTGTHEAPSVDVAANGDFVVAWSYRPNPTTYYMPVARRFTAAGAPVGAEIQVAPPAPNWSANVAIDAVGSFVVAWTGSDADGSGVFARRYDPAGQPLGSVFQVNAYTTGRQSAPAVDAAADGTFLVSWSSAGQDGNGSGVYGRRFSANGAAGPEFRINESTTGEQQFPSVAVDPGGTALALWHSVVSSQGTVWARRYATGLSPVALQVDVAAGPGSDGNRVLEAGESVAVVPSWVSGFPFPVIPRGLLSAFTGPGAPSDPTYTIVAPDATYDPAFPGDTVSCAPLDECYEVAISVPASRPIDHWDAEVREGVVLHSPTTRRWTLHVGDSFADVPRASGFYRFVETVFHHGITGGCGGSDYCALASTAREQIPVFVLTAREGPGYLPPACGTPLFADVPAASPFCPWIEELARRGAVGGCGPGLYCPNAPVTREQLAVFVLRVLDPALAPPPCTTPPFADVPVSSGFCPWIAELARRNVVSGCGGGSYCPDLPVTREQMAVFLVVAFDFKLYGP